MAQQGKPAQSAELLPQFDRPLRAILLFGPPGSGKGTLAKFLSSSSNVFHLSSGDIFRGLAPESPAGKLYYSYAGKGHLVPDEVTIAIWRSFVAGLIATNRYFPDQQLLLLDGIPRTAPQAHMLDAYLQVLQLIVLEMDNVEAMLERMRRRALVERRHDDLQEDVLRTRMEVYQRDTVQLLKHYPPKLVSRFNADQRPLEVLRDVLVRLSPLLIS